MKSEKLSQDGMTAPAKILVVDDTEQNLIAMLGLLDSPDLEILTASSGNTALEILLREDDIALALLDVQMPDMDGFELAELIRGTERTRSIPLIFLTAASHDPLRTFRGYEAGAVDFLYKPFDPFSLRSKVGIFAELHRQRRRIAQQVEDLSNALQLNELFSAVLAHDLRNPLIAIRHLAESMASNENATVARNSSLILDSSKRMSRMIHQLLELARLRSGAMMLNLQNVDLAETCRRICAEFAPLDEAGRMVMQQVGDTRGVFDDDRMAQVISNLLGNALEHGPAGQPVKLGVDGRHPDTLSITVNNRGTLHTVDPAELFKPFTSGNRTDTVHHLQGLGLGLHIVERFVSVHGGKVDVDSSLRDGTTFSVTIPRRRPAGKVAAEFPR
ncbi:hybrid sensor histidine kinase/response regulator [Uliginosibacterium sp. H1]|uniref:hybrid sensor histidine kinase/response regulator n=1 Tax=Uliginosibacterium sp. H1 TaxID=3114757 RepID=UPI002E18C78E|nr:hybrid sensor histidine kinase/response regulator [Uliginosibacterium sp. H1]